MEGRHQLVGVGRENRAGLHRLLAFAPPLPEAGEAKWLPALEGKQRRLFKALKNASFSATNCAHHKKLHTIAIKSVEFFCIADPAAITRTNNYSSDVGNFLDDGQKRDTTTSV